MLRNFPGISCEVRLPRSKPAHGMTLGGTEPECEKCSGPVRTERHDEGSIRMRKFPGTCEWVKQEQPLQKALQRLPDGRGAPGPF